MKMSLKVFALAAQLFSLTGCGDDANEPKDPNVVAIKDCINRGGHAVFSSDKYGYVYYIGCEMP